MHIPEKQELHQIRSWRREILATSKEENAG